MRIGLMSGYERSFDNAVGMVLDAIKDFPPAVALRALQRSIELTNAVLESAATGKALDTLIDLDSLESVPGLEETLAALLDVEPDVPTATGIALAALKVKLRECESPTAGEQ
jgi:hypothetical protein